MAKIFVSIDSVGRVDTLSDPTDQERSWWPQGDGKEVGFVELAPWTEGEEVNSGTCIECGGYATVNVLTRKVIHVSGNVPNSLVENIENNQTTGRRKYCSCK